MEKLSVSLYRLVYLGAIVCYIASIAAASPAKSPPQKSHLMFEFNWPDPDPNINQFPHESSCHHYYLMLSEQDISLEKCPDGQLFDYVSHSCSDKEHVHCWSRRFGKLQHDQIHHKHKKHFKCPYRWGKFPHLHDCTKYHVCLNYKSILKKCAPFERFDKISRKCIAEINAVCADKTDVVEPSYRCPKIWGSFTFSKDCSKYYECLEKKPTLRMCQIGKLFDDSQNRCVLKEYVNCGSRYNPYEEENSVAPIVSDTVPENKLTTLRDRDDISTITTKTVIVTENLDSKDNKKESEDTSSKANDPLTPIEKLENESDKIVTEVSEVSSATVKNKYGEVTPTAEEKDTAGKSTIADSDSAKNSKIEQKKENNQVGDSTTSREFIAVSSEKKNEKIEVVTTNVAIKHEETTDGIITAKSENHDSTKNSKTEQKKENQVIESDSTTSKKFIEASTEGKKEQIEVLQTTVGVVKHEETKDDAINAKSETRGPVENLQEATIADPRLQCSPYDSTCKTEKDGRVVRCTVADGVEPHPWDEKRFLECTNFNIQIYSCPGNLLFIPKEKKCRWKIVMA